MARKKLDPVTRYATDVAAGRIVAGRLVVLACQRHLRDLKDQAKKGLVWKPEEAQEAIDFFPDVLCLPEEADAEEDGEEAAANDGASGQPFVLTSHQQFIVGSLFGWFAYRTSKKTGAKRLRARFRIAYFEGAKGCGKTPLGAGVLILKLIRGSGAQLYCAAVGIDQAKIAFADCKAMVEASPALKAAIDVKVNNLAVLAKRSYIRPISSERRGLDGKRVQGAVIDELHEHRTSDVVVKVRAGIKGRPDALIFIPTNAGFDRTSVCWEYHEYSRQVLEGSLVNETWFAFVCHLDACNTCRAAGHLQPNDECPRCDDWKTEGPHWLKANPNLGVSIPWDYLREQVREALALPSQRNMVRRLNFCQWTVQMTVWIQPEQWAACASPLARDAFMASLRGRDCFVGIDLSDKIDLSAVVLVFPRPLIRPIEASVDDEPVAAVLEDVRPNQIKIDCAIDVLSFFWMPKETLQRRAEEDNIPYPDWEKGGFLTATPGTLIDHDAIVDMIIESLSKQFRIRRVGADASGATAVVTRLQRHFGDDDSVPAKDRKVIEIPQGFRWLSEPSKLVEALIVSNNVRHDGNPLQAWCMSNMGKEENHWREIRPVKLNQRKRIDGGLALIDGVKVMTLTPMRVKNTRRPALVYTPSGFQPVTALSGDGARV